MKLFRIISSSQGGQVYVHLAQVFGISDEMAAQAVRYFITPMEKIIARRTETVDGLLSVLDFLGSRRCDRVIADPRMFRQPRVAEEGKKLVTFMFGRPTQVDKLIENRAQILQIEPKKLEEMLPYIAVLAVGAMEIRTRRPFTLVVQKLSGGRLAPQDEMNPYAALATHLRRKQAEASSMASTWRRARVSGIFGALFSRPEKRDDTASAA